MPERIRTYKPTTSKATVSSERQADQAFYAGRRWRQLRQMKLNADPLCQRCGSGYFVQAHHIIDRKQRPDLAYCIENLESLCRSCHSTETKARQLAQ